MIFAIDPGPTESAWVIWDGQRFTDFRKAENAEVLEHLIDFAAPSTVDLVIEQVASMGMAVGESVFETVFWSGRFAQAFGRPFHRIKRIRVKNHLCGSSRAKDGNIRQAIIDRLGEPGTKKNPGPTYGISGDCWQALALAITWWDQMHQLAPIYFDPERLTAALTASSKPF
jgi:hypothetical protein